MLGIEDFEGGILVAVDKSLLISFSLLGDNSPSTFLENRHHLLRL